MHRRPPARFHGKCSHRKAKGKSSLKFFPLFLLLLALVGIHPTRAEALHNNLIFSGLYGASSKTLHNAGPPFFGRMGVGPLIGGSIGREMGESWRLGLKGQSIAREDPAHLRGFTVAALALWADRRLLETGPMRVGTELDLGVARVHRDRANTT